MPKWFSMSFSPKDMEDETRKRFDIDFSELEGVKIKKGWGSSSKTLT